MNRLRAYANSYAGMLVVGLSAGVAGLIASLLLFTNRAHCEPLLAYLLPAATAVIFRSPLIYRPEQYYWIGAYVGLFSGVLTATMAVIIGQQPSVSARIDARLRSKLSPGEAHGEPLER